MTPLPAPISKPVGPLILSVHPGRGSFHIGMTITATNVNGVNKNLWEFENHKRFVNNKGTDQWMGERLYKAIQLQFAPPPNVQKDIS